MAGKEWLAGSYSYADIAFYMAQIFGDRMGAPMTDAHPKLQAWRDRMSARPAVRQVAGAMGRYLLSPGPQAAGVPCQAERVTMAKILFLPGAGASPDFWKPVGALLPADWSKEYFGWPGLGDQPHDPAISGMDDLVRMVAARMDGPVDLVAQSMGGVIAARLAIEQPQNVRRLVLTVTSGGVDMAGFGAIRLAARAIASRFPARRRLDHRARGRRRFAARREDRRADAAAVGRCRRDQPGRRRPASRVAHPERTPAHRRRAAITTSRRTHAAEVAPLIERISPDHAVGWRPCRAVVRRLRGA